MRTSSIALMIIALAMSSLALGQSREAPRDEPSPAVAAVSAASAEQAAGNARGQRSKSGFGQVMAMLTQLLQEAALREQLGSEPDGPSASSNSAVTISVTPVAGSNSFFVKPGRGNDATKPAETAGIRDTGLATAPERNPPLAVRAEPGGGH